MNIGEHYKQHKILGTPSTKDNIPLQLPSMTEEERDALTEVEGPDGTPLIKDGMILYNTTSNKFQGYADGSWIDL